MVSLGFEFRVQGPGFAVEGAGLVPGFEFRILGFSGFLHLESRIMCSTRRFASKAPKLLKPKP